MMKHTEYTPKQRMLNAYRDKPNDRPAIAPEFWYYFPARILKVDMVTFQREIPFWYAIQQIFKQYETYGWISVSAEGINPDAEVQTTFKKTSETEYLETNTLRYHGKTFTTLTHYDTNEPAWRINHPVEDEGDLPMYLDMSMDERNYYDFSQVNRAYQEVGEDYLLELYLGPTFLDFIGWPMGFEKTVQYLMDDANDSYLHNLQSRYIDYIRKFIQLMCSSTPFESCMMGGAYANNSLLGPRLWRKWDKPVIKVIAEELHRNNRLLHIHYHGKCMETLTDYAELGLDCVCPFERPKGGDVIGLEGLKKVKKILAGKVTMNGNVHTVDTLIRGTPDDVRREVQEIKEAFSGSNRFIIGTGDQVGVETPGYRPYPRLIIQKCSIGAQKGDE